MLQLTDKLLQAVLAEAQVVCIGRTLLIAGDLCADPAVIPCLAKGISAGRYVDLSLLLPGGREKPDASCKFRREDCVGSRGDFILGCSKALPASTDSILSLRASALVVGRLMSLALRSASQSGLLAGLTHLMGPPPQFHVLSKMLGMC